MSAIDLHQQADELEHVRVAHGGFRRCALSLDVDPDARVLAVAISRARLGDREALRYLYVRYADNVYSYVVTIVHDPHEAEDVTQHVFVKLLTIIATYDEARAPFATWIMRVARNAAIDQLRQLRMVPCEEVRRDGEADTVADEERQRSLLLREVLALQDAGNPAKSDAFIKRWSTWDEAVHGRLAAKIREQQRYRYRLFTYAALGE